MNDHTTAADTARLHIATLEGTGWSRRAIAAHAGLSDTLILNIVHGQQRCLVAVSDRILAINPATQANITYHRGEPFISRVGTFRRIQALIAIGWTHGHIKELTGITTGCLLANSRPRVTRSTHDKIAAAYRQLATKPGPCDANRGRAARLGYVSPAGWDDIDNDLEPHLDTHQPLEQDHVDEAVVLRILNGQPVPASNAERRAVVARWPATGRSYADLAALTGWKVERYHPTTTPEEKAA